MLIVATPKSADYTQWARDWCRGGVPAKTDTIELCSDGGISHGGEIHAVKLKNVIVVSGTLPPNITSVAIAQHGMWVPRRNRERWLIVLEPSPDDLAKATGLIYLARTYGVFEHDEACLDEPLSAIPGLVAGQTIPTSNGESCYLLSTITSLAPPAP